MPQRVVSLHARNLEISANIRDAFAALRTELEVPLEFPAKVTQEADRIVANLENKTPQEVWPQHNPATLDIEFVTIDPQDSMDLDQAVHIARTQTGFTVHYAIADVAAFVLAGSAIDAEARQRGTTLYAPDGRTPLHPPVLSEGAASLLPNVVRPAAVWVLELDDSGELTNYTVSRGLVQSRARFSYIEAQQILDELAQSQPTKAASPQVGLDTVALLGVVGPLRLAVEQARGGVSLNVPEQEVTETPAGTFELSFRAVLPVEQFNAQISLLTGTAAAQLMLAGGVGVLRTLPPADPRDIARLRRTASALGLNWDRNHSYGQFLDTLNPQNPADAAFQHEAASLFRGADYLAFSADPRQEKATPESFQELAANVANARSEAGRHNAIGAHYAHVTAPLRRLGDRYATEICLSVSQGVEIPAWALEILPELPALLTGASRRGNSYNRATTDIVEAAVLTDRINETFAGVIVDVDSHKPKRGEVVIANPAVRANVALAADSAESALPEGEHVQVRLILADLAARKIKFEYAGSGSGSGSGASASGSHKNDVEPAK